MPKPDDGFTNHHAEAAAAFLVQVRARLAPDQLGPLVRWCVSVEKLLPATAETRALAGGDFVLRRDDPAHVLDVLRRAEIAELLTQLMIYAFDQRLIDAMRRRAREGMVKPWQI
jgi:hypothetical protein